MCGRFTIAKTIGLYERFRIKIQGPDIRPRYNIAPSQEVPVITSSGGIRQIVLMRWGLFLPWKINSHFHPINARSEGILEHPFYRSAIRHYRCLIPATGFYEWKKEKRKKVPYLIKKSDDGFMAFAGIYYPEQVETGIPATFAVLTTEANEVIKTVHERMPVILTIETENIWLSGVPRDSNELSEVLSPYPAPELELYQVSDAVNDPKNDSGLLIRPINSFF